MESAAGPSRRNTYHRDPPEEADEARNRTIKVTMGGGLWTTADVLAILIADSTLREMATPFPDGRDGETNVFFVSFLSAETAQVVVDSVASSPDLTAAMVTNDEFEVFQAIYSSSVEAAAMGFEASRKGCFSEGSSSSKRKERSPDPERDPRSDDESPSSQDDEVETDREARAEGLGSDPPYEADGVEGIASGPPPKRRRLSLEGSDNNLPVVSDSQRLRDTVGTLIWAIGLEFGSTPVPSDTSDSRNAGASGIGGSGSRTSGDYREGSASPRLSSKAKGKRPMK